MSMLDGEEGKGEKAGEGGVFFSLSCVVGRCVGGWRSKSKYPCASGRRLFLKGDWRKALKNQKNKNIRIVFVARMQLFISLSFLFVGRQGVRGEACQVPTFSTIKPSSLPKFSHAVSQSLATKIQEERTMKKVRTRRN